MPRVRDVLLRFRPSGAPGAATAAGVPVDRAGELETELGPVLGLLAETERECAGILEDARVEAAAIRARAEARARDVLAAGQALVEPERVAAVARSRGEAPDPRAAGPAGVAAPAVVPESALEEALAHHVDLVVAGVRQLLRPVGPRGPGGAGASTEEAAR